MKRGFLVFLLGVLPVSAQAQVLLRGLVEDAESGAALPAAHVLVEGTARGTITNTDGWFELVTPALPVQLRVRYIGYRTQRVTVTPDDPRTLAIRLEPVVYELDEVFVAGEDFAANVMRKVIERKQQWRRDLHAYEARGYTRITLENEARIALLSETVFDVYWDRQRGPREVVRSRRETADFYRRLGIAPAGYLANLYDDVIDIQGLGFIGPTHPDALRYYTFSLAARRGLDDQTVYDLFVAPRTGLDATFIGRISVLDGAYTLLDAELRPARHVVFPPPVEAWAVTYRQQFVPVADTFWLPVDLRLEGAIRVDPGDAGYGTVAFRQVSRLSAYRTNAPLPEEPFAGAQRVTVDSLSVFKDDLFLLGRNVVPLTPREAEALDRLRGETMTLERAFPPKGKSGALAAFEAQRHEADGPQFVWPVVFGYRPWLRFNRVDGYFFGIGQRLPLSPRLAVEARAAQTTRLRRIRYLAEATYRWGRGGTVEGGYRRDVAPRNRSSLYPMALNALSARSGQGDYFDYYWNEQAHLKVGYAFPLIRFSVGGLLEKHESVERGQKRPWPFDASFRENPPIEEGKLRAVTASVAVGDGYKPFRWEPLKRAEVRVEHSHPDLFGGDFDYTRVQLRLDGYAKTFFASRPRPNGLDVRVFAGASSGALPPQRLGVLDGTLGPFSTFGALRSLRRTAYEGTRYLGVFWEHDFRTVPFETLGLRWLVERNMGVRLFGGHGRTWLDDEARDAYAFTPRVPDGFHHELGLALTHVGGSPLRLDVTYRIDEPGFFVGLGLSRLF